LTNIECQGFDEHIIKSENIGFSFKKLFYLFLFLLPRPILFLNYQMLREKFQWYYKRKTVTVPVDLSEVLYELQKRKEKNIGFYPFITNDNDYQRKKNNDWWVIYNNGQLFNQKKKGILIFHFGKIKNLIEDQCKKNDISEKINILFSRSGINVMHE
jgi:hypothetical protein